MPVAVTLDLLQEAMYKILAEQKIAGFLIDGFPRELSQAKAFHAKFRRDCDFVLYFDCSESAMRERLLKRGETSGRADDNAATIVKRLKTFVDQTVPVANHYERLKKLCRVNADRSIEDIHHDVQEIFRKDGLKRAKIIFVLGGPGCGKGTQCTKLAAHCVYKHFSTGDLLRAEVAAKSELGQRCEAIMKNGGLVPVEDTLELLYRAMLAAVGPTSAGFLVDGFPRELSQVTAFTTKFQRDCNVALYFECSDEVMLQRILMRGQSSGRADDNADAAKKRLETFRSQSLPVVQHYQRKHLVRVVNAERPVEEIFQSALSAV